jgi:hypothetical protein
MRTWTAMRLSKLNNSVKTTRTPTLRVEPRPTIVTEKRMRWIQEWEVAQDNVPLSEYS